MNPKEAIEYGMIDKVRPTCMPPPRVAAGRSRQRAARGEGGCGAFVTMLNAPDATPRPPTSRPPAAPHHTTHHTAPHHTTQVLTTPMPKMPQLGPKFKFERQQDIGV